MVIKGCIKMGRRSESRDGHGLKMKNGYAWDDNEKILKVRKDNMKRHVVEMDHLLKLYDKRSGIIRGEDDYKIQRLKDVNVSIQVYEKIVHGDV